MTAISILNANKNKVSQMLVNGICYREIGEAFGVSKDVVSYFAKLNGVNHGSNQNNEIEAAQRIFEKTDGRFEYVSGYTNKAENKSV